MSQSQTQSILGATPYRNPRHEQEAAELEAHLSETNQGQAQSPEGTPEVKPEHNWEKRYKDLQSYTAKKINGLESEIQNLKTAQVPKFQAPKTQEELDAFAAQNPDMYAVIQSMAHSMVQDQLASYDQKLAEMQGTLNTTAEEKAKLALKQAHPDYEQVMKSDQFHEWAGKQTMEIQDWVYRNPDNANLAIQAVSLFKYHSGWGNKSDTSAQAPQTGGDTLVSSKGQAETGAVDRNHPAYVWKESEIGKMRPDEFAKWEEHISLAQREGRILFGQ